MMCSMTFGVHKDTVVRAVPTGVVNAVQMDSNARIELFAAVVAGLPAIDQAVLDLSLCFALV